MLHKETVERTVLELLKNLLQEDILSSFNLAGGTALALYMGHRKSVDLDLFTPFAFDAVQLKDFLESKYGFCTDFMDRNTLKGTINGINVNCIAYEYDLLKEIHIEDGIRLFSMEDIAAMKLSDIILDRTRLNFIDVAFLSTHFSFYDMLQYFGQKFPNVNIIMPLKAIIFFEDIDFEESIVMLNGIYNWKNIEKRLVDMTISQSKVFRTTPLKNYRKLHL